MKRLIHLIVAAFLLSAMTITGFTGCGTASSGESINVFNWGEYIDESLLKEFQKETGIKVNYNTAATCEEMYAKMKNGGVNYDIVVPSDYMVSRMIEEDMLSAIDYNNVPNAEYIDEKFIDPEYDPSGEYSVPYQWGRVAIIYNKDMVDEEDLGGWDILWNEKYKGQILMFDNSRDAMGIALKRLGASYNTTDTDLLRQAADLLIEQKPLVQAYVMDQIFDKMESGEAAIAPYYIGDYYLMLDEIEDSGINLGAYIPEGGTNLYVDAMCIPKDCQNKSGAETFINFMLDPEVMAQNTEYIYYSTAETAARELLPDELKDNEDMYPSDEALAACETYINLPESVRELYDSLWVEIMSS
jgi:spermidine/putrescine transport system substrate-binding protein